MIQESKKTSLNQAASSLKNQLQRLCMLHLIGQETETDKNSETNERYFFVEGLFLESVIKI